MTKTIYLQDDNNNYKLFEYENISDLKEELLKRNISIGNNASIGYGASVGYGASIGDNGSIGDNAYIGKHASIGNNASIGSDVSIGHDACIGKRVSIGNNASIGSDVSIGHDACISKRVSISDDAKLIQGFYVNGSKHPVTYKCNYTLSIGCHNYSIDKWLDKCAVIGKKEGYSEEQIKEYQTYIKMAKMFHDLNYAKND